MESEYGWSGRMPEVPAAGRVESTAKVNSQVFSFDDTLQTWRNHANEVNEARQRVDTARKVADEADKSYHVAREKEERAWMNLQKMRAESVTREEA